MVCIHHTYNNLAALTVTALGAEPVFKDEYAEVDIILSADDQRMRDAIHVYWEKGHDKTIGSSLQFWEQNAYTKVGKTTCFREHSQSYMP